MNGCSVYLSESDTFWSTCVKMSTLPDFVDTETDVDWDAETFRVSGATTRDECPLGALVQGLTNFDGGLNVDT